MVYEGGRLPLYHFDLYRLDDPDQLEDIGLYDVLGADGVCVIEWGEQFADELGDYVSVRVTRLDDEAEPNNAFPAPCPGIALAPELAAFAFAVCIQTRAWAHPSLQIHPSRCSSGQLAPLKFS